MYQRQRQKGDLAATMMAGEGGGGGAGARRGAGGQFSREELRRLFSLNLQTRCDTADLLAGGGGSGGVGSSGAFSDDTGRCADGPLAAAVAAGLVSFVHLDPARQLAQQQAEEGKGRQQQQPEGLEELEVGE